MNAAPEIPLPLKVSDVLAELYRGTRFVFAGEVMMPKEVFHSTAFLPLILHEAEARARALFGRGLNTQFLDRADAMFGKEADLELAKSDAALALALAAKAASTVIGVPREGREIDLTPIYLALLPHESPRPVAGVAKHG